MVQKTTPQAGPVNPVPAADTWPADVADVLGKVSVLLEEGQPAAALKVLAKYGLSSPWLANATAVCQLRLGNARIAVDTLRGLVLAPGGLLLREDVPVVFKINFATALMADGNLSGGLRTLGEVRDESHPGVREIRDAIRRWEGGLSFGQKLWWTLGGQPSRPFVLDITPGRLR
jgi:hypothetical protein